MNRPHRKGEVDIELHGHMTVGRLYRPIKKAWEAGAPYVRFINGHSKGRGSWYSRGGTTVRQLLRAMASRMKQYMYVTDIDVSHDGSTLVRIKANLSRKARTGRPSPSLREAGRQAGR